MQKEFNLLVEDLQESIAVVLIQTPNGHCSHANAVHDGLVLMVMKILPSH
jgi:hypothetical protein